MNFGELWHKFRRRTPHDKEDERSADSVEGAVTVAEAESYSTWVPSQQDGGPQH